MTEFFKNLEADIYNAIKADIEYILTQVGKEKIYSIALVTDEDCISLYLAANTSEYVRKKDFYNLKFMRQYSKLLFEQEEHNSAEYANHKPLFFETITSALKRVIDEKSSGMPDTTFFITLSDGDGIEEIENYSAQQLNSAEVYEKFLHRFDGNQ